MPAFPPAFSEISAGAPALYRMTFSQRRLPHWRPEGKPLFLTWHLHGSLPHNRFPPPAAPSAGKAFVWMDRCLDEARFGPSWLKREELARIVVDTLRYAADTLRYFDLYAYVVMPNHVHVLLLPLVDPSKLLHSVKGFSAREANKLLARSGEPFWQRESYDHWARNETEFERIRRYIEENPVRAGLAATAEEYPWSSAHAGTNAGMAG
jgi:REP element-mobilizing transposase RayT